MSVKLNSSGGGSVTLQEPTTASDFTLTLPAQTANVITDSSGVLNIGSGQIYKDASGNVGIGTSSPSSYGNGLVVYNAATGVVRSVGGSVISYMFASGGGGVAAVGTESNHPFAFYTNNAERARIDTSGKLILSAANQGIQFADGTTQTTAPGLANSAGTSASGLSVIDFTSIPAGAKRFTLLFTGVSLSGNSRIIVQLGSGGGITTSGYSSGATFSGSNARITTGFLLHPNANGADIFSGQAIFTNTSGNIWGQTSTLNFDNVNGCNVGGGYGVNGGTIDRVRVTSESGTTFDAGTVYIIWG